LAQFAANAAGFRRFEKWHTTELPFSAGQIRPIGQRLPLEREATFCGHRAMNGVRHKLPRIHPIAVAGVSLVLLHALTLLAIRFWITSSTVWALAWVGLGLSVVVAACGIAITQRQHETRRERLRRAHELLNLVAASLETSQPFIESRSRMDMDSMDSFVERLTQLVTPVERVVEERRQRERELLRADQLAMVGQMAAGVAHELRNPLTSIKMLVQTAQKGCSRGLADDDLAIIEHEIRRLEKSLQRFLDFARPPRPERRPMNLATVIDRALALIEGRARKQRVSLSFVPPAEPIIVEADADQVEQLLLNLMLNSLDVMPDGGALTVELAGPPGGQAELRVRDTGPGIPAELLPRLFDPFVSTKETGIGLGLAVSHRIAERHGGKLSAANLASGGACFVLRLARADETATVA
jgi:signal transduction histidine kinase